MLMSELLSCKFNIDTACVELRYADGEVLSIYTPGIEGSFDTTGHWHKVVPPQSLSDLLVEELKKNPDKEK